MVLYWSMVQSAHAIVPKYTPGLALRALFNNYCLITVTDYCTDYCLINEQECFIRSKATRPASLLNGFKHDYKFNRYIALLVFFI